MTLLHERDELDSLMHCFTSVRTIDKCISKRDAIEELVYSVTKEDKASLQYLLYTVYY